MVAAIRDDPARRLGLASRFYDDRPGCVSIRSYRRAEMAFMRWQVRRGLLAAPDAPRPGSEWWRAVNEGLLRDAWEADQLLAGRPGPASRPSVSRWSGFLERPSAVAWYRAHNASIVAGYIEHHALCAAELPVERAQVRPACADLVLTSTLSVPAGSVLERLAHVLDLRRRLRLRVVLQYLDVLAQVSE
jgi:hypothetical protein